MNFNLHINDITLHKVMKVSVSSRPLASRVSPFCWYGCTTHLSTQHTLLCGMVLIQDPILCHHLN